MPLQLLNTWNTPMAVHHCLEWIVGDGSHDAGSKPCEFHDYAIISSFQHIGKSSAIQYQIDQVERRAWVAESGISDDIVIYLAQGKQYDFVDYRAKPNVNTYRTGLAYNRHYDAAKIIYDFLTLGAYPT